MSQIVENWSFFVECISALVSFITAFILFFKTKDVKYLRNLRPPDQSKQEEQTQVTKDQKPEVYLSVNKLVQILEDLQKGDDDNANSR